MEYQAERNIYGQRVVRGEDNLRYLKDHSNFLTHGEKKALAVLDLKKSWDWGSHLWWLDMKRRAIDEDYKFIRLREIEIASLSQQVKNIQQTQAISQLKRVVQTGVREPTQQQADNARSYLKSKGKL